jgi:hypothetical protein
LPRARATADKHRRTSSPYRHLLKPKAGALALSLNAMGERFHSLIDTTIVYPDGVPSFGLSVRPLPARDPARAPGGHPARVRRG